VDQNSQPCSQWCSVTLRVELPAFVADISSTCETAVLHERGGTIFLRCTNSACDRAGTREGPRCAAALSRGNFLEMRGVELSQRSAGPQQVSAAAFTFGFGARLGAGGIRRGRPLLGRSPGRGDRRRSPHGLPRFGSQLLR